MDCIDMLALHVLNLKRWMFMKPLMILNPNILQITWDFLQLHVHDTLEEIWDFVTNEFATSCDYLTFTTIVGYIYNYFLHLKSLATTLWLTYD